MTPTTIEEARQFHYTRYYGARPLSDYEEGRCISQVWTKDRWPTSHQCKNKIHVDGYCKIHSQAYVEAKRKDQRDQLEKAIRHTRRQNFIANNGYKFYELLVKLADGGYCENFGHELINELLQQTGRIPE